METVEQPTYAAKRRWQRMQMAGDRILKRAEWEAIKQGQEYTCAYCGCVVDDLTQDHVIPLSRGGMHVAENVVGACVACNNEKGSRTPREWGIRPFWWTKASAD